MHVFTNRTFRLMLHALVIVGLLSFAGGSASAQQVGPLEYWSGSWVDPQSGQGGHLEFLLNENGMIEGSITNGINVGLWSGFMRNDGIFFAQYYYPTMSFGALAAGVATGAQGSSTVVGEIVFVTYDNEVLGLGQFELERVYAAPGMGNQPATDYPFTGNGLYVFCSAPSICGDRGANALPGNWSWTSGLFDDIEANYPQVYCNLFVNAC